MILIKVHAFAHVLSAAETWMLHAGMLAYLIASLLAVAGLFWPRKFGLATVNLVAGIAIISFGAYFITRFTQSGTAPLQNVFEILLLTSLGLCLGYVMVMLVKPVAALAACVFPMATIIVLMALPTGGMMGQAQSRETISDPLLISHIILAVIGTAQFMFSAAVSLIYLLQDRALQAKRDSTFFRSLPPLESLRGMVFGALNIGLPIMTISLMLGFIAVGDQIGHWISDPLIISTFFMWLIFLTAVFGRKTAFFRGRRAMYLVLAGFGMVLVIFFGTGLLPRSVHSFAMENSPASTGRVRARMGHLHNLNRPD